MHSHPAEVVAEAGLHEGAGSGVEGLPTPAVQHRLHYGRHAVRSGRLVACGWLHQLAHRPITGSALERQDAGMRIG
jgi:hypothetical protein